MQPHPHSGVLVSVHWGGASGFYQTVQRTSWGTRNRGYGTPHLCISPWVQGPWDGLAGVWGCCVGGKPLWHAEVWGFFWLSPIDHWCMGGSDWSLEASGHLPLVLAGYCCVSASGWTSLGTHSASKHPQLSPLPHIPPGWFFKGHGDWCAPPNHNSLHARVLVHPTPTGPTQQRQGYSARILRCTVGLKQIPSEVIVLLLLVLLY